MTLTNLFSEICDALYEHNYSFKHIAWVGTLNGTVFDSNKFFKDAVAINYNSGYGLVNIREDLVIKMCDGSWFSRNSYDGSEWFQYNCAPSANKYEPLTVFDILTENYYI